MKHSPIVVVLLFVLVVCTVAIRQFTDEYPNVTVCESTLATDMGSYDMPHSYTFLRAHFSGIHRCTHIEGHLIIQDIWPNGENLDFSFLENIEEVSGMVLMRNNTIGSIILPKLKVIRGDNSLVIRWEGNTSYGVSLYLHSDDPVISDHLILPSLKVISNNSVYFKSNTSNPYLPHSIRWPELFEDENNQRLLTLQVQNDNYQCHPSCNLRRENSTQAYCWSPSYKHCQEKTNCKELSEKGFKWCYFKKYGMETKEIKCSSACMGGCSGIKSSQCYACKHFINGDTCIDACPPEYIIVSQHKIKNKDYKRRVGMMCATTCPGNLLPEKDACIYRCTSPEFYRFNDTCVPCENKLGCNPKECIIQDSCERGDSTSFYMTKDILERLTDCEHVIGQLQFSDNSFDKKLGEITVEMMYKHLKNVKRITGDFAIDGTTIKLHNLTFLQNLEEIRHLKQSACDKSSNTALNIFYTDLEFLGLRRLRHVYGEFSEISNRNICYVDTLPWTQHILKLNLFKSDLKKCNKSCDPQCGNDGCWGPTNSMCYICKGVRAGYNCVEKCEDEPGYYTGNGIVPPNHSLPISYDDGTCQQCHPLCQKNCTGPSTRDCIGGCRFFEENKHCVRNCSKAYYEVEKRCVPCHKHCMNNTYQNHICTGGGDHQGQGGCTFCSEFILRDNRLLCFPYRCPPGYYADMTSHSGIRICKPCTKPCSECEGRSLTRHDCKECNGYWRKDVCVKSCGDDTFDLIQQPKLGIVCRLCHAQCAGCSAPDNNTRCTTCRNKRIYIDVVANQFMCVENCPASHNYSYKVKEHDVCITSQQGREYEEKERQRKLLNIFYWIAGPTILSLILAGLIIFQIFKKNKKKKSSKYLKAVYSNIHEPDSRILLFNKESVLAQPNMNRLLLIPTTNIVFDSKGKPLGTGAFGSVYRGVWRLTNESSVKKENNELDVAIKVIDDVSQKTMEELLAEAKVMASVSHKHCLRLIGVCLLQKQPCLVTSFMELGSLDKYLKKHQYTLSSFTLLSWAEQIANGMTYLEMRGIIHRDLATRNVLLNNSHILQITDFGLSRILHGTEENNQIIVTSGKVPIRWLAPETLSSGIYSHKTDVWAYGVTLWEIFTFGERPYDDMPIKEIPTFLSQKNRLPQPEICSLDTYVQMLNCWKEPEYRASFEDLMNKFSNFSQHSTYYLNIPNDPCLMSNHINEHDTDTNHKRSKAYMWQDMYRQLPSLDGTITTCLEDYPDGESMSARVKRQSSNLSYLSGNFQFCDNHENVAPLLYQSMVLSETAEEDDGYLEPKKTRFEDWDNEYLEPIKR